MERAEAGKTGAGAVNTEVIFNGYPDSLLRKSGARVKKERVVLCASRMQPHKRVDVSLRYFEQVFGPHPEWRLIVVGSGPEGQLIDGLVASSPFSDRIERLNEIPQTHVFELMRRDPALRLLPKWLVVGALGSSAL